jgi:flagellar protein FliL
MATAEKKSKQASGGGILGAIFVIATITTIAVGAGIGTAWLVQTIKPAGNTIEIETPSLTFEPGIVSRSIAPVIASLAGPTKAWIRIEFSVLLPTDLAVSDHLAGLIAQDALAYVRTVSLNQVDTPFGLAFLREDIEERVKIRTEGRAKGVLFRTLVIE